MRKLILIIEDNKTIAMYESETLKSAGYDVVTAHNSEQAKAFVLEHKKDIVLAIVDINLPDDKVHILDYLLRKNIPAIAMTGSFHPELRDQVIDKDIIDYIVLEDDQQLEYLQSTVNRIMNNKHKKILIVDDSKASRFALKKLLMFQNFTIFEAGNAKEALAVLKEHNDICIALIDYEMPGMNGAELARIIRHNYSRMELSILAISAHSESLITIEFLKAGANDFITKPYVREEVLARMAVNIDMIDQHHSLQSEIYERKKAEVALRESQQKSEAASLAKSNFLANMSHEVRTPMNAILGFVDVLCKHETSEEKLEKLNIIKESGTSLMNIIDDILDFSKLESGKLNIENILFKTSEPFEFITKLFNERARQKGISITLDIAKDLPADAYGDITRIKQIYSNLLSNALKFSHNNSKIEVSLRYLDTSSSLLCSVKDYGIGIAKENLDRIFQVFEQEDTSTTRNFGGSGLGLSISKSLAKMMHGKLYVESEIEKGSTFFFQVELFKDVDKNLELVEEDSTNTEQSTSELHARVLLVEDNKSNQLLMKIFLEELGLTTDIANDGLEAVSTYEKTKYDIILMDENMPNLNGIMATERIRQIEKETKADPIPIIAVTANALKGDREKFLASGMNDYIAKPIELTELEKVLRRHLS